MTKKVALVGAGPGGYVAAIRLAQLGAQVALVEKEDIGGACLNRGCIPTKAYARSAHLAQDMKNSQDLGLTFTGPIQVDGQRLQDRKKEVVDKLVQGVSQLLASYDNIKTYPCQAQLVDSRTLKLRDKKGQESRLEDLDAIILAQGASPFIPPIEGVDLEGVITSNELLDFTDIPSRLVVIGGGAIGLEFASIYQELGSQVQVVTLDILEKSDKQIAKRILPLLKKQGIQVHKDYLVDKIEKTEGGLRVSAHHRAKAKEVSLEGDYVLVAMGRRPVLEGLDLEGLGLKGDARGLEVDEHFETSLPGVYAIGDLIQGSSQLAHVASAQGEYVAEKIMGLDPQINLEVYPSCVFTLNEVAQVGYTEEELKAAGIDYQVSRFNFAANGKALCDGEEVGFIKILAQEDGQLLGTHILGPHASDLIGEAALAQAQGLGAQALIQTIHSHPSLSEAMAEAAGGLFDQAIHLAPRKDRTR
ncbi:MAG: dihydrolipoyl dehydrogenase [Tissierellia bacterium]|nr:dihydrolipoyl dehydrogenase [Tissierellia bacterium]